MSNSLPQGWANMPVTQSHSPSIKDVSVGWGWSGMPEKFFGSNHTSGTGKFGFIVRAIPSDSQSFGCTIDNGATANVLFHIEVTNPESIGTHGIERLHLEMLGLAYSSSSPIPKPGSVWQVGSRTTSEPNIIDEPPIVWGINFRQLDKNIPYLWAAEIIIRKDQLTFSQTTPEKPSTKNTDEPPWAIGANVSVDFSVEDFVLGLGKYLGTKTPGELSTALKGGTYASEFNDDGAKNFELVTNSANDPLESPPPMKVGTASISINRAFKTMPDGLSDDIQAAIEQVCNEAVTANGITFPAYTCKLATGNVVKRRHKRNADWLPRQKHPFSLTYDELGWVPPAGYSSSAVAVNRTKNVIPAFTYIEYYEVTIAISQRNLGWGYALVDKGYRKLVGGKKKEIRDVAARQAYPAILEEGNEVDMAGGAVNKKVLRLYQVLNTGNALTSVFATMMADPPEEDDDDNGGGK